MTDNLDVHPAPFHELLGIELAEWRDGYAKVICDTDRRHSNRSGITHGGVMLSLIDQAAAYAGLWCSVPGNICLLYTSPSPRDGLLSRMPSSA